jgi:hypothetical protein
MGWVVNATRQPLYPLESDPVTFVQEAGLVSGPVWMGAETLAPNGIRTPNRPARGKSLYYYATAVAIEYVLNHIIVALTMPRNNSVCCQLYRPAYNSTFCVTQTINCISRINQIWKTKTCNSGCIQSRDRTVTKS